MGAQSRCAIADLEYQKASEEVGASLSHREFCEADVDKSKTANLACDSNETGLKRKREELKATFAEAKQSLKCARAQEKEATSGRDVLYKQFAKGGDAVKEELANAKQMAQASAEEQEKAV